MQLMNFQIIYINSIIPHNEIKCLVFFLNDKLLINRWAIEKLE